jgi:diaminopimelate epimerase
MNEVLKMKHWLAELVRPAVAIAMNATGKTDATSIDLNVEAENSLFLSIKDDKYINVFLKGP